MEGFIEIEKYQKLQQEFTVLQSSFEQQKFQLEQLKRMIFGAKSERFISNQSPEQLSLFAMEEEQAEVEKVKVEAHEKRVSKKREKPKRLPLPQHLEHVGKLNLVQKLIDERHIEILAKIKNIAELSVVLS